jgi:hypothetical protein
MRIIGLIGAMSRHALRKRTTDLSRNGALFALSRLESAWDRRAIKLLFFL